MKTTPFFLSVAIIVSLVIFSTPLSADETVDKLQKALDLVHQVEKPVGAPPGDPARIESLSQAIENIQQAPNHRLKGHRVLAIQALRGAIAAVNSGDSTTVGNCLQTAETELKSSLALAGGNETATPEPAPTAPASLPAASSDLFHAVESNDLEKAKALLQQDGAKIEERNNLGNTALLEAVEENHKEMAALLLDHGASVDAPDKSGCTPLIWASIQGYKDVANLLLAHKADVKAQSPSGQTALSSAAMNGHKDVAEILLAQGADIKARGAGGETPLDWAVENGHVEMVAFLLDHGADINAKANNGTTPLRLAELCHNYDVAALLRQRGGREPDGTVPTAPYPKENASTDPATLQAAIRANDLQKIKALIQAEPQLVVPSSGNEFSPLVMAAAHNQKDTVEFLLASHADINAKDSLEMTALIHAAIDGHMDMAELLLAHKADPNVADRSGLTPLFQAALMGRKDMAELLLAHGADVNAEAKKDSVWTNSTPLYIAACNGSLEVVKLLLAHGADRTIKGKDGLTPLEVAIKNHRETPINDVAALLR